MLRTFVFSSILLALEGICSPLCASTAPRTLRQMQHTADSLLGAPLSSLPAPRKKGAPTGPVSRCITATKTYAIYGSEDTTSFVILSTDDLLPAVLAYIPRTFAPSHPRTFDENRAFSWWLQAIDETASDIIKSGKRFSPIKPDTKRFPEAVPELVTAKWGQEEPYSNLCPYGTSTGNMGETVQGHCLTGCVATALAQIMYYHRFPQHGQSYHSIYYPAGDVTGQKLEVDFSESYYDWDNMLDSYRSEYNEEQALAVAKLMYDCGVASNMIYRPTASAALTTDAAEGLVKYFGYATTTTKEDRDNYSDEEWMEMVFTELAEGRPIFYGANDVAQQGGHAFVVDGYNADGLVHVNWGWYGDDNGYFDISLLNPRTYQFSMNQDAIIGIKPDHVVETIKEDISLSEPGQLATRYSEEELLRVKELTISGPLDADDIRVLRFMAGSDDEMQPTQGILKYLDLTNATILSDITPLMFAHCTALQTLRLPSSTISIGDGAFIGCTRLQELTIPEGDDKEYRLDGNLIYNADKTELIAALPYDQTAYYVMPQGLTAIHDYAFYEATKLVGVEMPNSVTAIGQQAFRGCASLRQLKLFAVEPPVVGSDCFQDVVKRACTILVRAGSKVKYEAAEGWRDFKGTYMNDTQPINFDNIKEFGTTIKVTNAYREYGEPNPSKYGYKVTGDALSGGVPELTCDADEYSPVGEYPIHITAGSITDEAVDYVDGTLFVLPALLTVTADDAERPAYSHNPEFTMSYEGWRNDEDESVLDELPIVTTTATWQSPAGEYPLTVSGGQAHNYELEYIPGILTITDAPIPTGIGNEELRMKNEEWRGGIYDLMGRLVSRGYEGTEVRGYENSIDSRSEERGARSENSNEALDSNLAPSHPRASVPSMKKGIYIMNGKKIIIK